MKFVTNYYKLISAALITLFMTVSVLAQTEATTGEEAQQESTATTAQTSDAQPSEISTQWRTEDFKPYTETIEDLKKLSKEYSENILTLAIDEYATGADIINDMEAEIELKNKQYEKQTNLNERWYWQEIDRMNQHRRQIRMIKYSSKLKSVTYFTRAINHMDQILNEEVLQDKKFIEFKTRLFRAYVASQYDIHNLKPCIPILERYIEISEETKKDFQAYLYLASCYNYMENSLKKYKTQLSEDRYIMFRQKKNDALLKATEIQYGIDSAQYKKAKLVIDLDETKSEQLNEFK
jgi:hypothetical protein